MHAQRSTPVKLSANLGFLWTELGLPEAIRAAGAAGFDAVECHFPYEVDPGEVRAALEETGLPMVALNTARGNVGAGDSGLAAVPGRADEARALIDQAIVYAAAIGCANVHVMAGRSRGAEARAVYLANLGYAAAAGAEAGVGILIEALNHRDAPGYFLSDVETAAEIAAEIDVAVMFDCYHVQIMQGDLLRRFEANLGRIGHVQFAGVPTRAEPDAGEVDYAWLLPELYAAGYEGYCGAEYRPSTSETAASLAWMDRLRSD